jgi:phospholipase D-like protein
MSDWTWGFVGVIGLIGLIGLAVWIWALVDAIRVPDDSQYRSGNKLVWVLVIVLAQLIGAIIYFVVGRPEGGASKAIADRQGRPAPGAPPPPPPPPPLG